MFVRDPDDLLRWAAELAPSFRLAEPFPHSVIDGLFDEATLSRALDAFPSPDAVPWYQYDNPLEQKLATPHVDPSAPGLSEVFQALQSPEFIRFLEALTGIDDLSSDDELVGAGLHQIEAGGSVAVHVDSNYQPNTMLDRRVNALVFLNKDWPEEYGGHLELWDATMTSAVRRILPLFNRTVIFVSNDDANHGHPEPLNCPPGRSRKSLAAYYYTDGRPVAERSEPHSTVYRRRPQDPVDTALDELRARRAQGRLEDRTTADRTD